MEKKLTGKIALITGSSSGIGKSIAILFAKEGADIIITSNKSEAKGKEVLEEVLRLGSNACYINADLSNEEDIERLFKEIEFKYGRLDILVNNAGTQLPSTIESINTALLDKEFKVNVYAPMLCVKRAIPLMKNGGNIINTSSIRGIDYSGRGPIIGYGMTKSAINNLTKTLAVDLAPNILVNGVIPGFVETENYDNFDPKLKQLWLDNLPIKRFIKPEEIAEVYLLLATTKILTGSLIVADGGATLLCR